MGDSANNVVRTAALRHLRQPDLPSHVRIAATRLAEGALELLAADPSLGEETVHRLRVTSKKLRALWNLAKPELPPGAYEDAKERLRLAAKRLAGPRDAAVMLQTLKALDAAHRDVCEQRAIKAVLTAAREQLAGQPHPDGERQVPALSAAFAADRASWQALTLVSADAGLLQHGLRRTYGRARRLGRQACESGGAARFHRWRRWEKYLLYQLEVLRDLDPARLAPYVADLKSLGKLLGKRQDLANLRTLVSTGLDLQRTDKERVERIIARREDELEKRSRRQYGKLFAEPPTVFAAALAADLGLAAPADSEH